MMKINTTIITKSTTERLIHSDKMKIGQSENDLKINAQNPERDKERKNSHKTDIQSAILISIRINTNKFTPGHIIV